MVLLAMKCSSFCGVNRGTSGRSPICGLGNYEFRSVREANVMMSRLLELHEVYIYRCWTQRTRLLLFRRLTCVLQAREPAKDNNLNLLGGSSKSGVDSGATANDDGNASSQI